MIIGKKVQNMKIGIIGTCGHGGTAFAAKTPVEFVGMASGGHVCDTAKSSAQRRDLPFYEDWRELLDKVDAIIVDTVFGDNAKIAAEVLRRGIPVYGEKPAATTFEDLALLEEAAKSGGVPYFSMLTLRFDPWFTTAKTLCDSGAIGRPLLVTGQKSYKLGTRPAFYSERSSYGGTIPWIGIHVIDQALWLTGLSCTDVSGWHSRVANGGNGTMESAATVNMTLEKSVEVQLHMDYLRPSNAPSHGDDRIRIAGDKGVIEVRGNAVWLINSENDGKEPMPLVETPPIFDHFIKYVQNIDARSDALYAGIDGFEATRIALKALKCADDITSEL